MTALLELRDVHASYGEIEALTGVNLAVEPGEVFGVLGPNGAGKTTMLRVAAGLHSPTSGDVTMAGRRVNGVPADVLARAGVCLIPEGRGIFPNLTVREHLRMATYCGVALADVEEAAYHRFPRLKERRDQSAGTMSGGEQQMLSVARAVATKPAVLLLDELSMGLAPMIVEELYATIANIAKGGMAIIVVEQFAKAVLGVASRAAIMVDGRVTATGTPAELHDQLSAAYLGTTKTH